MTNPDNPLHHYDLLLGAHWKVPLDFRTTHSGPALTAIKKSAAEKNYFPVEGTSFFLKADLKFACDGNATFRVGCSIPLGGGSIIENSLLYTAAVSCIPATRPLGWRFIYNDYLHHMLASDAGHWCGAPRPMSRDDAPVLYGFGQVIYRRLKQEERAMLLQVIWATGLELLRMCKAGVAAARGRGEKFVPDPELFLELGDW